MKTVIRNIDLWTGENDQILRGAEIQIEGDRILFAGDQKDAPECAQCRLIDGGGRLAMPSLVNAHTHNAMTLLRGIGSDLPLDTWLNDFVFPTEQKLNARVVRAGVELALLEHLRFGTTVFNDMYMFAPESAELIIEHGLRAKLCDACVDFGNGDSQLENALSLFNEYNNAGGGAIKCAVTVHAEYTSNPAFVKKLVREAERLSAPAHVHISETRKETEECISRHGKTPARYFHDLGLFDRPTVAAHCVWLNDDDIALMKADGVTVAHCPVSNLKLGSGVAPVKKMLDAGVSLSLGTDGAASNNNLNLWEEIKLAAILHKGVLEAPQAVTPFETLKMATNARPLGFDDMGVLKEGFRADLILVDLNTPSVVPDEPSLSSLVYDAAGSDVYLTMAGGKVLYRDGEYTTLDKDRILSDARAARAELLS